MRRDRVGAVDAGHGGVPCATGQESNGVNRVSDEANPGQGMIGRNSAGEANSCPEGSLTCPGQVPVNLTKSVVGESAEVQPTVAPSFIRTTPLPNAVPTLPRTPGIDVEQAALLLKNRLRALGRELTTPLVPRTQPTLPAVAGSSLARPRTLADMTVRYVGMPAPTRSLPGGGMSGMFGGTGARLLFNLGPIGPLPGQPGVPGSDPIAERGSRPKDKPEPWVEDHVKDIVAQDQGRRGQERGPTSAPIDLSKVPDHDPGTKWYWEWQRRGPVLVSVPTDQNWGYVETESVPILPIRIGSSVIIVAVDNGCTDLVLVQYVRYTYKVYLRGQDAPVTHEIPWGYDLSDAAKPEQGVSYEHQFPVNTSAGTAIVLLDDPAIRVPPDATVDQIFPFYQSIQVGVLQRELQVLQAKMVAAVVAKDRGQIERLIKQEKEAKDALAALQSNLCIRIVKRKEFETHLICLKPKWQTAGYLTWAQETDVELGGDPPFNLRPDPFQWNPPRMAPK